jgi:hypothetical protein
MGLIVMRTERGPPTILRCVRSHIHRPPQPHGDALTLWLALWSAAGTCLHRLRGLYFHGRYFTENDWGDDDDW